MARKNILLITRNLPPLTGGMERLNWHLAAELAVDFEVHVAGPKGCADHLPQGVHSVTTFCDRPVSRFIVQSLYRSLHNARHIRPHLIIAGSGVTAPHAVLAARLTQAPTLVYLHGLDIIAVHPLYQWGFLPFIRRCGAVLVNSQNTARLAKEAGIEPSRMNVLHPGVSLPDSRTAVTEFCNFSDDVEANKRPILLSVGRLTSRKGLVEFVDRALPQIVAAQPNVLLVIIGGEADRKLVNASTGIGETIRRVAVERGLGDHVRLLGQVDESTLQQAYQTSDLHVFPVRDLPGDVEGFGMVAVEAAAYGVPTIAFRTGGIADAVAHGESGMLIAPDDYAAMANTIMTYLHNPASLIQADACRQFAERFSWQHFGQRLRQVCHNLLSHPIDSDMRTTQ